MATQKQTIKDLEKELRRLRLSNLKLKMHMQVLINHPFNFAAGKIRSIYNSKELSENMTVVPLN